MDQDEILIDDPRNARVRVVRHPSTLRPGTYPVAAPRVIPAPFQAPYYQPAPVMAVVLSTSLPGVFTSARPGLVSGSG